MANKITAFVTYNENELILKTVEGLKKSNLIQDIFLLTPNKLKNEIPGCRELIINSIFSSDSLKSIYNAASTDLILFITREVCINFFPYSLERFVSFINDTDAGIVYADYMETKNGSTKPHLLIDYHIGSLRDTFDFGPLVIIQVKALAGTLDHLEETYKFGGLYNIRLLISEKSPVYRIQECLYESIEAGSTDPSANHFDYLDPKNREAQIEMERAVTCHLKRIGAYLAPVFKPFNPEKYDFEFEATVVIPVKDRAKTICDAVESALKQKTNFPFNIIVVNNHSTDGTTDILNDYAEKDKRIIHIIPEVNNLGIGGCWNVAVNSAGCGRYCIQLDSDDIYYDENVLQKIVDLFHSGNYASIIGSYKITDFNLAEQPPGVIKHEEWTPENGRNNALRINGLGAPRAFYTPVIRKIGFPNTSYGEDYSACLAVSRYYQIGRIFEPVYLCRRWDGNSDAALTNEKLNSYNAYKDRLRAIEILARQKLNRLQS